MRSFIKGLGCGVDFQYYDLGFGDGIGYGNTGGSGSGDGYGTGYGGQYLLNIKRYPFDLVQYWER